MNERRTIGRLGSLLRLHRWGYPAMLFVGLLQSLAEGIGIGLFIPLLTGLVSGSQSPTKGQWLVDKMDRLFGSVPADRRVGVIVFFGVFSLVGAGVFE